MEMKTKDSKGVDGVKVLPNNVLANNVAKVLFHIIKYLKLETFTSRSKIVRVTSIN